ncbi:MAG TPA: cytochrome c peroxidase [Acetobacteraceae bacterium]|nr:cytochrome c peroxidase [Acetobacteraceae bacterium]
MRVKWVLTQEQVNLSSWRRPALASRRWSKRHLCGLAALGVALVAGGWLAISARNPQADLKAQYRPPVSIPFPSENPFTIAKANLGRALFFDTRLSGSQTMSCASCHQPGLGWSDGRPRPVDDDGQPMAMRTPTLIDDAWTPLLGWDGKFADIEAVTRTVLRYGGTMNLDEEIALKRIAADPEYARAFAEAFPDHRISGRNLAAAIATFERLIVTKGDAPFDRWIAGEEDAISPAAKRGFDLFNGRARCSACHSGWTFTDGSFHDVGNPIANYIGRGRYFPTSQKLKYAFKTPTLRGVAERGPYMHDGSMRTLTEVIDLYDRGGIPRPSRADVIKPLHLTQAERSDLLAFLKTLSGHTSWSTDPPLPVEGDQNFGRAAPSSTSPPISNKPP